jgi:hypothetical protein
MNATKLRELADAMRGEMRMGITAQRLAVLTLDALDTIVAESDGFEMVPGRRVRRTGEAILRETAVLLLEDIEIAISRRDTRERKLAIITTALRRFYSRYVGG